MPPKARTTRFSRKKAGRVATKTSLRRSLKGPMAVHSFKRSVNLSGTYPLNWSLTNQSWSMTPSMGQIGGAGEFTSLFDMWKLKKVVYHFEPLFSGKDMMLSILTAAGAFSSSGLSSSLKYIRVVHDYNDSTVLASEDAALQYENCKSYKLGSAFKVTLYPKILAETYRTAVTSAYQSISPKYFDTTETAIPHYGVKVYLPQLTGDINDNNIGKALYTIRGTFYFDCKNVK